MVNKEIYNVIDYAKSKNIEVVFGEYEDEAIFEKSLIKINDYQSDEMKLYVLLHEVGHFELYNNENYKEEYFGKFYAKSNNAYKISYLMEEMDAWKEGKRIAKNLGIEINSNKWNQKMVRCLFAHYKYIR